jgi:hypothetical protein
MTDSSPLEKDPKEGDLNSEPASWVGLGLISMLSADPGIGGGQGIELSDLSDFER